jgi:hypothetical protein
VAGAVGGIDLVGEGFTGFSAGYIRHHIHNFAAAGEFRQYSIQRFLFDIAYHYFGSGSK